LTDPQVRHYLEAVQFGDVSVQQLNIWNLQMIFSMLFVCQKRKNQRLFKKLYQGEWVDEENTGGG
jgi:hypothetical protein